jgi:hypothetical protein
MKKAVRAAESLEEGRPFEVSLVCVSPR